jgi:alpha-mannosidase
VLARAQLLDWHALDAICCVAGNDIGAAPGQMGAHGHEADGGCECDGLTMRGKHYLVFDTITNANAQRRKLSEALNFPPTLAFSHNVLKPEVPSASALAEALPANIKLLTLTNNYMDISEGKVLLRLAHLYSVGEHPTLSQPVIISLAELFKIAGHRITAAEEMSLTANQLATTMDTMHRAGGHWTTDPVMPRNRLNAEDKQLLVTIKPMEVRTFLITI